MFKGLTDYCLIEITIELRHSAKLVHPGTVYDTKDS